MTKDDPSKAWYDMPVFLGMLGGIIAFVVLARRDRGMAYKSLIIGTAITVILVAPLFGLIVLTEGVDGIYNLSYQLVDNIVDTDESAEYADEEAKRLAVTIPYDFLMSDGETYSDEIVHYVGVTKQVKSLGFGEYLVMVAVEQDGFLDVGNIWVNYEPVSDEEKEWMGMNERESNIYGKNDKTVEFWGVLKGLKEYNTLLGATRTAGGGRHHTGGNRRDAKNRHEPRGPRTARNA